MQKYNNLTRQPIFGKSFALFPRFQSLYFVFFLDAFWQSDFGWQKFIVERLFFFLWLVANAANRFDFVKKKLLKSDNCVLALRKRLFCAAKPTLLPCKRAAFGMQNNRFCNVLTMKLLGDRCCCEKYLHFYNLFLGYMMMNIDETK